MKNDLFEQIKEDSKGKTVKVEREGEKKDKPDLVLFVMGKLRRELEGCGLYPRWPMYKAYCEDFLDLADLLLFFGYKRKYGEERARLYIWALNTLLEEYPKKEVVERAKERMREYEAERFERLQFETYWRQAGINIEEDKNGG